MWREDDARFYGMVFLVSLSLLSTMILLCWMNRIPQNLCKYLCRSCRYKSRHRSATTHPTDDHHRTTNVGVSSPSESPAFTITEIDDFQIHQAMDEVEIFLAEVRRSALSQPSPIPSNLARHEFISNLLITENVTQSSTTNGTPCAICLGEYQPGDTICSSHNIKCTHNFHKTCILRWLLQDRDDCPCCRNNYLALSDDEEEDDDTNNNENDDNILDDSDLASEDLSNHENNEPQNTVPTIQFTVANQEDWIPSYLAPFHSPSPVVPPPQESQPSRSTSQSSLNVLSSVPVERRRDINYNEDHNSQSSYPELSEPDAWSCPSVDEEQQVAGGPYDLLTYQCRRRQRQRRKQRQMCPSSQPRNESNHEILPSLQLDDLILEGLLERLQDRAHEPSIQTSSSSSIYTEGTLDVEAPSNTSISERIVRDETEVCAICCKEYAVNEELCWSQDAACAHVFHRRCIQLWILEDRDYCPFCRKQNEGNQVPVILATTPLVIDHVQQQHICHHTDTPSINNDETTTDILCLEEFSRLQDSGCTSDESDAHIAIDYLAEV